MDTLHWWRGAVPHKDIREGRFNPAVFEAKLSSAIQEDGPSEYSDAETFFNKTFLTHGLRSLLMDVLRTLSGQDSQNTVVSLQTNFGGGKTHSELSVYHLLKQPERSLRVPQVRQLVAEVGLDKPPTCRVAALLGSSLNPLGRTAEDGTVLRTLWGEMAYQLGGKAAYELVAENDARRVSPGEETLERLLKAVGPSVILFDETLHYVDKVSHEASEQGDLASQTVAFLRELTAVVGTVPRSMLILSLTASRTDQLSPQHLDWLERMNKHVNRVASLRTPVEGTEIHEIVRRRLFDQVDAKMAQEVAQRYHRLYTHMNGLPAHVAGASYQQLIERSYPFHPELVTVLYERWGSKPSFQLTRGTLRFLALVLQDLWRRKDEDSPDLLELGDISLAESNIRTLVRDVAGDSQWEAVFGSDVAGAAGGEPAKAQKIDRERGDSARLSEALATTILLYSLGGGENPAATRHELRLSCSRPGLSDAVWDDLLGKFRNRLFYYYSDDAKHKFRKEPNVVSLHHTHVTNLQDSNEVDAYMARTVPEKSLGKVGVSNGFSQFYFQPGSGAEVPDDGDLKLVVLGFAHRIVGDDLPESTQEVVLEIMQRHGQVLRQRRNTLVFCLVDAAAAQTARNLTSEYLGWRKIQTSSEDWDRIGGAQQELVKEYLSETEGATQKALISAYTWALVPAENPHSGQLEVRPIRLGAYGPGKLVAPMAWERLTAENGTSHLILTSLTPQTLVERYGTHAWPESESWITTAQLWERFTRQVALPILARQQVLLDALQLGQLEGFFAIGDLADEGNRRDQRDSYLALFFRQSNVPANVPMIGERWLLLRPGMFSQIVNQPAQVTPQEIAQAITDLSGENQPVKVPAVFNYIKRQKDDNIDVASFHHALTVSLREKAVFYRAEQVGPNLTSLPEDDSATFSGFLVIEKESDTVPKSESSRRIISIKGKVQSLNELAQVYQKVLRALDSQKPSRFSIGLDVTAEFETDPGGGFDAVLQEYFDSQSFPGLSLTDSKSH